MPARLACLAALLLPTLAHADAKIDFERLKALVGHWEGTSEKGKTLSIDYRTTANGSVLLETWTLSPTRESLTVYHLDGDRLLATHYCPIGNQPRMAWQPSKNPDVVAFEFESATNLPDKKKAHQQRTGVVFEGPDKIQRTSTYREDGKDNEGEVATLTRVRTEPRTSS